ncbi:MAG: S8 family serine peptidase [Bdellovibrionales bacterium]|nr:S8 family serine peptidase [Bdellovibrionales bacterium]
MQIIQMLLSFSLAIFCIACSADQTGDLPDEGPNGVDIEDPKPIYCKKDEVIITENGQSRCLNPKIENYCLAKKDGFQEVLNKKDHPLLASCLRFKAPKESSSFGRKADSRMIISEINEQKVFADWADQNKELLNEVDSFTTSDPIGQIIIVGEIKPDSFTNSILDSDLMAIEHPNMRNWPHGIKYFANSSDLIAYFNKKNNQYTFKTKNLEINELVNLSSSIPSTKLTKSYSKSQCKQTCLKSSEWISAKSGMVQYREYLSEGQVYRSEWVYKDENGFVSHLLYLTAGQPSLALAIDRDASGFPTKAIIKNRFATTLFTKFFNKTDEISNGELHLLKNADDIWMAKVGMCEDGLNIKGFLSSNPGSFVLKGSAQSYLGWSQPSQELNEPYAGRLYFNELGLPFDYTFRSSHAQNVAGTLAESSPVAIIPLGLEKCIDPESARQWWPQFLESEAKVVNLSGRDYYDSSTCKDLMKAHPIRQKDKALWVIAAGNQNSDKPTGCPQHLNGQENILIVGASEYGHVHSGSNYGNDFVDLFTEGKSPDGSDWGTSYAAPRVSNVAAELASIYPNLSVKDIKAIIMLTVEIPYYPLPARSGGMLDRDEAFEFAKELDQEKMNWMGVIESRYCGWTNSNNCKKRKSILKNINLGGF